MHHRPHQRKEERGCIGKRKYILYSLFSILSPSYRRESKDLRWVTKSAINYVHLLISVIEHWIKSDKIYKNLPIMCRLINSSSGSLTEKSRVRDVTEICMMTI